MIPAGGLALGAHGQTAADDRLARALLAKAQQPRMIRHPMQGLGQLASVLSARMRLDANQRARDEEDAGMADLAKGLLEARATPTPGNVLGGGVEPPSGSMRTGPAEMQPRDKFLMSMLGSQSPALRGLAARAAIGQALAVKPGYTLGEGQVRYGPDNKVIATGPKKYRPPNILDDDKYFVRKLAMARAGAAKNILAPTTIQERQESKDEGSRLVTRATEVFTAGDNASKEMQNLLIAKRIPVTTGSFEPLKAKVAALAQGLGFDPGAIGLEGAENAQAFEGIMQNLVLTKMQAQKGPQTENDAKRIEKTVANLGQTGGASSFLLDAAAALRQRDIERADFWRAWRAAKKSYEGAETAWQNRIAKQPLVGTNPKTGLPVFFYDFKEKVGAANPGASENDIVRLWWKKYGGTP